MIEIHPAAARYETVQPGITTWHCFSAGAHYAPDNTGFGGLIALDEHVVAPGAGFGRHAHRGVDIVSWVLAGTLRHEDSSGRGELVGTGTALHQSSGSGIEHTERNASATEALRFIQLVLLGGAGPPGHLLGAPPMPLSGGEFAVLHPVAPVELPAVAHLHLYVASGAVGVAGHTLHPGDSARVRTEAVIVVGAGEILLWRSGEPAVEGDR
jgi:redox-sensitive bicupin YhaK (pirin superfamily)